MDANLEPGASDVRCLFCCWARNRIDFEDRKQSNFGAVKIMPTRSRPNAAA